MARRALPPKGHALGMILGFVLALSNFGNAAAGCYTVTAAVQTDGTITIGGRAGFTAVSCAQGKGSICDCKGDVPLQLPLKMCGDNQTHAEDLYIANVLPKLQNNFDKATAGLVADGVNGVPQAWKDHWKSLGEDWGTWGQNRTLYEKFKCALKSGKTAKDAVCNVDFIYKSNGVQACEGDANVESCVLKPQDCLALEDKLFENCDTVNGVEAARKGRPALGIVASGNFVTFDSQPMCKYPAMKCFKQTAEKTVTPRFCDKPVNVPAGRLNVCAYDQGRADNQWSDVIALAESALVTDEECKQKYSASFCRPPAEGDSPVAKCSALYCNADTLFSDFSGGAKEAPSSSFSLLKKMDGSEHYAHHFDGYFIDGIGSYDVSKSKWGLGCQSDSDCKPFTDAAGMTSLPKADVGNVPCCSFYAEVYSDVCTAKPTTYPADMWPWELNGKAPCRDTSPCTAPEKPIGVPAEETKEMKVKMTTSGYTSEGFLEVKPKFEEAIAKAVGAPSASGFVRVSSWGRRAGNRALLAEEMPFTVVLNVPKSMVESVTTKLNKDNINKYLKEAGLNEISGLTIEGSASENSASLHPHGGPLFMALAALCSFLAGSVGQ